MRSSYGLYSCTYGRAGWHEPARARAWRPYAPLPPSAHKCATLSQSEVVSPLQYRTTMYIAYMKINVLGDLFHSGAKFCPPRPWRSDCGHALMRTQVRVATDITHIIHIHAYSYTYRYMTHVRLPISGRCRRPTLKFWELAMAGLCRHCLPSQKCALLPVYEHISLQCVHVGHRLNSASTAWFDIKNKNVRLTRL